MRVWRGLTVLAFGLALGLGIGVAQGAAAGCPEAAAKNDFLQVSTIRLWAGGAPGAKGTACEDVPWLTVLPPQEGQGNGSAVIVFPGGAYMMEASNLEGRQVANWFTSRGFTAFVLHYRLGKKYLLPVPLVDARRAVQLVRARARDYHLKADQIGVIGFSAGGHLAGLSSTQFVAGKADAEDPIERSRAGRILQCWGIRGLAGFRRTRRT